MVVVVAWIDARLDARFNALEARMDAKMGARFQAVEDKLGKFIAEMRRDCPLTVS